MVQWRESALAIQTATCHVLIAWPAGHHWWNWGPSVEPPTKVRSRTECAMDWAFIALLHVTKLGLLSIFFVKLVSLHFLCSTLHCHDVLCRAFNELSKLSWATELPRPEKTALHGIAVTAGAWAGPDLGAVAHSAPATSQLLSCSRKKLDRSMSSRDLIAMTTSNKADHVITMSSDPLESLVIVSEASEASQSCLFHILLQFPLSSCPPLGCGGWVLHLNVTLLAVEQHQVVRWSYTVKLLEPLLLNV